MAGKADFRLGARPSVRVLAWALATAGVKTVDGSLATCTAHSVATQSTKHRAVCRGIPFVSGLTSFNPAFGQPPSSGTRDNHRRGTVGDFLRAQLQPGADLDLVTAYFPEPTRLKTLRQKFEELFDIEHPLRRALDHLQTLDVVRIIEGKA